MAEMSIGMMYQDSRTPPSGPAMGYPLFPGPYPGTYQHQAYQPVHPPPYVQSYPNPYVQMMPSAHPSPPRQPFVQPGARRPAEVMQFYPSQQSQWDSQEGKVSYRPPQTLFRPRNLEDTPCTVPSFHFCWCFGDLTFCLFVCLFVCLFAFVVVQTGDGYEPAPPPSHILEVVDILETLGEEERAEAFAVRFSEGVFSLQQNATFSSFFCFCIVGTRAARGDCKDNP